MRSRRSSFFGGNPALVDYVPGGLGRLSIMLEIGREISSVLIVCFFRTYGKFAPYLSEISSVLIGEEKYSPLVLDLLQSKR